MKITFIGTGSISPNPKIANKPYRSCSAIFIELESRETLLFDIGPGTLTKLQQTGIDTRIHPDHLFITHYHIDHCGDYPALLKSRWFHPQTGAMAPQKKITVHGPFDLVSWTDDLCSRVKRWNYMSGMLSYREVALLNEISGSVVHEAPDWNVLCAPVKHYDGVAFRLNAEGKSFVYSGDMQYDENLSTLGNNADMVAVECSFPEKSSLFGAHLCPEDIATLAKLGNFKQTILTHMYPACEGREADMKTYIESNSNTKVTIAEDFLTINL